jgi:hypothetical protein
MATIWYTGFDGFEYPQEVDDSLVDCNTGVLVTQSNMQGFMHYILCEMSAEDFFGCLYHAPLPMPEKVFLADLAYTTEGEMVYEHVVNPNDY